MINAARRIMLGALAFLGIKVNGVGGNSSGTATDRFFAAAVDSAGSFLAAGNISVHPGYLVKFDPILSGSTLWQREQSMGARFQCKYVGVDSADNVYLFAHGYAASSPELLHLFKYNSAGVLQWQRKFTDASSGNPAGLTVSGSGDCYAAYWINSSPTFCGVVKYNSSGALQWQRKLSSTYATVINALCATHDGGVVVVGYFFDGVNSLNNARGIVVKFDSSGALQWQYKIHFSVQTRYESVAVDSVNGDIYVGGLAFVSGQKAVLVKLNSSGAVQWHKIHPTTSTHISALSVDNETGNIYAHDDLTKTITAFDSSGATLWTREFTAETLVIIYSLLINQGSILVAGSAQKSGNGYDFLLLKIDKNGGGDAGVYGHITIADPGAASYTTGSITSAGAGLTDAAGTLSDAAGIATDAASTLSFYSIP